VATWDDWLAVGRAIAIGRTEALRIAKTNKPLGSDYNKAMRAWLHDNGLAGITAQERHSILNVLEHLPAIEAWRQSLAPGRMRKHNHPAVFWVWKKATRAAGTAGIRHQVVRAAQPKSRACGRPIYFDQDAIRRGATAMRESRSNDWPRLARICLEAALPNEDAVLCLLDAPVRRWPPPSHGARGFDRSLHPEAVPHCKAQQKNQH
jgi:hypothetical protein